ncbi:glucose/quinate/shikimate family membrane-bound PQQ-dependent dehydrogenase [Corticibacter populi]|uniref:Glucose/quinate/shikimate family membrane-bound PQQ-dependent dehydrogenase n=1 Tax=Corticibacter populi TaxID=1550736 RepID=A0A3M6QTL5_9BURK|nr:glucose/quinate/shikimate family membrane-bound PQQ-dependent dehydrogenase [Corticibacter populi]RMX06323.1 glucose/quinate/shikimate family membrane-bound PQQ-dependent dehydrogenase [Corticibacter populi]RZS32139.1 quinate dehydrogenase (quinone) [Corticibacter populi]
MNTHHPNTSPPRRWPIWIASSLVLLFGLFLGIGGAYLAYLGGSWYFVLSGLGLLVSAVLMFGRRTSGAWLFALVMVLTIVWAVADAGLTFWPLVSRLFAFGVLSLLVALAWPSLARAAGATAVGRGWLGVSALLLLALVITAGYAFMPAPIIAATQAVPAPTPVAPGQAQTEWRHWGGTTAGDRFAALDQINKDNVKDLQVAWTAHTGDIPQSTGAGAEDQNTPLQIGDTLYVCTPYSKVIALDVDTGAERWRFDAKAKAPSWQRCRGLGYYEDAGAPPSPHVSGVSVDIDNAQPGACSRRLLLPTLDARLIAISADNGQPCAGFGNQGTVHLSAGMGEIPFGWYQQTSTPLIADDLVVVGGRVADNWSTDEPSGVVRAFDVHSGELVWAWDSGNPEITGLPPEGQTYTRGSPNVWAAMAFDPELDLIYLPTGNSTPDFWGAQRTPEEEKYSSSIVAVEARTGRVRWHFQTTHHDLWDFDLPAQPLLYDVPNANGGTDPALVQVTKQGEIFMFNRATGEPLAEIQELPVPQGKLEGERYSATQPFSVGMPSIGNETLVESDMWGATPLDQLLCRIKFKSLRHEGVYTPPGLDPALQMPGSLGGMNWGGVSVDKTTGYMFVNDMRLGLFNYQIPRENMPKNASGIEMGAVPMEGTPYGAMRQRFLSQLGVPCQKPPFGTMTAIDLKTRQIAWQVPVGTVKDTGPLGIRMGLPIPVGMPTLGPSLATQSGLVFFAGTQDFYLRAFDGATGQEIWKARLPVGSQSGPMTYVSPKTGKQYVIINAGGARQSPDRGDYIIAYALPGQ